MRQRRREARARPTLPAWPERGLLGCPTRGGYRRDPESRVGGGGLYPAQPWGRGPAGLSLGAPGEAAEGTGRLRETETPARRRPHKGRGRGPRRGTRGWGCGSTARNKGGGRGAQHSQGQRAPSMPAAQRPGRAKRARPRSRPGSLSGRGAAPWNSLLRVPAPACCSGSAPLLSAHARTRRARRAGRLLPAPGRRGGAGPGTPIWPRARAATCGLALRRRHRLGSPPRSRAGLQRP